jgi:hypothetical protein
VGTKTWVSIGAAVLVLAGGAGVAIAMAAHRTPAASDATVPPPSTAPPATAAAPTCPLTGAPAPGGQVPQRPALAVKVDNYPAARPQSGLNHADVIFEEPVEGFITRYVAVFQCQAPGFVGPVRSARAVDVQILDELSDPLFFHVGGINPVISLINSANDVNLDLGSRAASIAQHPAGRYAPYDTYMSTSAGWALDPSDHTPPAPLFAYGANSPAGTPVSSVHIRFSSSSDETWTWNAAAGGWALSYSGVPADMAGGAQLTPANVVVQLVNVTFGPWVESGCCAMEVQSQMTGSGPADVFRNGQEITGTWQRPSLTSPTTFTASDGSVIPLAPGQTWVDIVPNTIAVTAS